MKMTEDIRKIAIYNFKSGEFISNLFINLKTHKEFELKYRFDNQWHLIAQEYNSFSNKWEFMSWGPLNNPIYTYEQFKDVIISISTINNNAEIMQDFFEKYLVYKANEIKKITKRI